MTAPHLVFAEALQVLERHGIPLDRYDITISYRKPAGGKRHTTLCNKVNHADQIYTIRLAELDRTTFAKCCTVDLPHSHMARVDEIANSLRVLDDPQPTAVQLTDAIRAISELSDSHHREHLHSVNRHGDDHPETGTAEALARAYSAAHQRLVEHAQQCTTDSDPAAVIATVLFNNVTIRDVVDRIAQRHRIDNSRALRDAIECEVNLHADELLSADRDERSRQIRDAVLSSLRATEFETAVKHLHIGEQFSGRWGDALAALTADGDTTLTWADRLSQFARTVIEQLASEVADELCDTIEQQVDDILAADADTVIIVRAGWDDASVRHRQVAQLIASRWGGRIGREIHPEPTGGAWPQKVDRIIWHVPQQLCGALMELVSRWYRETVDSGPLSDAQLDNICQLACEQPDLFTTQAEYVRVGALL